MKQQRIAKDSLRALESLSETYEREKREIIARLDREREELIKREESKSDARGREAK